MESSQIQKYFQNHNRERIKRLIHLAPTKHKPVFQALSVIFHTNHTELPGHIQNAPLGIVDYQPTDKEMSNVKKSFGKFHYAPTALPYYPILGLYLINDGGALHYPAHATFDLWLIYSSKLTNEQVETLKQKLQAVLKWAKTQGVTLKARILNHAAVTEHKVADDDLDRFYTNGLILAGSLPAWWFVAPDEADYLSAVQATTQDKTLKESLLDFGPLTKRNPNKVIDRAINICRDTMIQGLPLFVDLFYIKFLLTEFETPFWLSDQYKQRVYRGETNTSFCEPLLLKLSVLENIHQPEIQHLFRQSLYLHCRERLSLSVVNPEYPWRRDLTVTLSSQWNWSSKDFSELDLRKQAKARLKVQEFRQTERFTDNLIEQLKQFSNDHQSDLKSQIEQLELTHHQHFDSAPDIIPQLPKAMLTEEPEEHLTIEFDPKNENWMLSEVSRAEIPKGEQFSPLHRNQSIVRLLAWAILNGALTGYTRIKLVKDTSPISLETLTNLVNFMVQSPLSLKDDSSESNSCWLFFANIEQTPQDAFKQQDMKLPLHLRDPLNYGYHRQNMVLTIEVVANNSKGKWRYLKYDNVNAMGKIITSLLSKNFQTEKEQFIDCWCPTPNFNKNIVQRLTSLSRNILQHCKNHPENGLYLFEEADRLVRIRWQNNQFEAALIASRYDLGSILSQPRTTLSATEVDEGLDRESLYHFLLKHQYNGQLQLFLQIEGVNNTLYLIDELGTLVKHHLNNLKEHTIFNHFEQFLSHIAETKKLGTPALYKLIQEDKNKWKSERYEPIEFASTHTTGILIEMTDPKFEGDCIISCEDQRFEGKAKDANVFKQAKQYIESLRSPNSAYPIYITELRFTDDDRYRSIDYIRIKQKLEKLLNSNW